MVAVERSHGLALGAQSRTLDRLQWCGSRSWLCTAGSDRKRYGIWCRSNSTSADMDAAPRFHVLAEGQPVMNTVLSTGAIRRRGPWWIMVFLFVVGSVTACGDFLNTNDRTAILDADLNNAEG